jgi:Ca2+-binding RTX toxin-like protein
LQAGSQVETLSTSTAAGTTAINLTGNEFANSVNGNAGANALNGGVGNDTLWGGAGTDTLTGSWGADRLNGGPGADRFDFDFIGETPANGFDTITDFSHAQADRIDLSTIDARTTVAGDQAFTFIGGAAFTGVAGQLRFASSGGNTWVAGDVDGNAAADFLILLTGIVPLLAGDFLL